MDERPRIIFWELTKRCNLKCAYCRVQEASSLPELIQEEALRLVRDIKSNFPDALLILSGGEPLLRKDLFDILRLASLLELKTSLATNGTLLSQKEAVKIKELGVRRVGISLDSSKAGLHDASKGICGSYREALGASSILKAKGIPFQVNFTITKMNKDEIRPVADLAFSLGAEAVHYFVLVPTGCGRKLTEDEALDAQDTEEVLAAIKRVSRGLPIEIRPTCAPQYVRFVNRGHAGCLAGSRVFFISSEGDVYPCGYLPVKAGSLREGHIGDIWRNSAVFKELRENNLKGACYLCFLKDKCRGCRARAYSLRADYMAEDPSCFLSKEAAAL